MKSDSLQYSSHFLQSKKQKPKTKYHWIVNITYNQLLLIWFTLLKTWFTSKTALINTFDANVSTKIFY